MMADIENHMRRQSGHTAGGWAALVGAVKKRARPGT